MQTASSVVINEVLPISGEAGFVEFYNPLNEAIELRNHYLSDTSGQLDKYLIKEGLMVPAKEKAVLQFQTIGLEPRADLTLTLTAPDSRTPLTAIQATFPQDGRSTGRKPDGGSQWYAFTDPTPGTPNGSDGTEANLHLNEVHYSEEGRIDWLEWINLGDGVQDHDRSQGRQWKPHAFTGDRRGGDSKILPNGLPRKWLVLASIPRGQSGVLCRGDTQPGSSQSTLASGQHRHS